eukprot:scpid38211/ scgid23874/ 
MAVPHQLPRWRRQSPRTSRIAPTTFRLGLAENPNAILHISLFKLGQLQTRAARGQGPRLLRNLLLSGVLNRALTQVSRAAPPAEVLPTTAPAGSDTIPNNTAPSSSTANVASENVSVQLDGQQRVAVAADSTGGLEVKENNLLLPPTPVTVSSAPSLSPFSDDGGEHGFVEEGSSTSVAQCVCVATSCEVVSCAAAASKDCQHGSGDDVKRDRVSCSTATGSDPLSSEASPAQTEAVSSVASPDKNNLCRSSFRHTTDSAHDVADIDGRLRSIDLRVLPDPHHRERESRGRLGSTDSGVSVDTVFFSDADQQAHANHQSPSEDHQVNGNTSTADQPAYATGFNQDDTSAHSGDASSMSSADGSSSSGRKSTANEPAAISCGTAPSPPTSPSRKRSRGDSALGDESTTGEVCSDDAPSLKRVRSASDVDVVDA